MSHPAVNLLMLLVLPLPDLVHLLLHVLCLVVADVEVALARVRGSAPALRTHEGHHDLTTQMAINQRDRGMDGEARKNDR